MPLLLAFASTHEPKTSSPGGPPGQPCASPRLTVLGLAADLTASGSNAGVEMGMGMNAMAMP